MHYLTEFSAVELQRNFESAHEQLKQVFSKYPHPRDMEGCPCCVREYDLESLKKGDLNKYLGKAMTTWGGENDFKHYLPQLFSFIYLEKNGDTFILLIKLNYVQNWTQEEIEAIAAWFSAYSQYTYIDEMKKLIEQSRLTVQDWLEGRTQELSCEFPFSIFLEEEFTEMSSSLGSGLLEKFAELLNVWPQNETDFVVYASCSTNYLIFGYEYGIFKERVPAWISKNIMMLEELFWKTEDPRLQKLFSDAI
ncbi:MAG TPA: hypothetical protein VIJ14_01405, partial [Rhabdochlamydiaceae bacterium]